MCSLWMGGDYRTYMTVVHPYPVPVVSAATLHDVVAVVRLSHFEVGIDLNLEVRQAQSVEDKLLAINMTHKIRSMNNKMIK